MESSRLRYQPSFDGLRGMAVLAVMAFHAEIRWAVGGFLGVDVFFVLSGFLITSLLSEEWERTGALRLGSFYVRRALRLLPALLVLAVALQLYALTFVLPEQVTGLRRETLATLFYVANWAQAFGWVTPLGFFSHAWSLAIEEQFYLVWPVALGVLLRWLDRGVVLALVVAAAAASALLRAHLWRDPSSFPRVFYGFDTRAEALLIGAAAALFLEARREPLSQAARRLLRYAGALGALGILALMTRASWLADYMYAGGFTAVAVAASLVLAEVRTSPQGVIARALAFRPLVAVGSISYGLYLWHWPLFVALRPEVVGLGRGPTTLLRFAATFVAATVSYLGVERVFLRWKERWHAG